MPQGRGKIAIADPADSSDGQHWLIAGQEQEQKMRHTNKSGGGLTHLVGLPASTAERTNAYRKFAFVGALVASTCSIGAAAQTDDASRADELPTIMSPPENVTGAAWVPYRIARSEPSQDQSLNDPILKGAIDLHAHFGPDTYNRQWDAFEIVRRASAYGMRGVVLKSHWTSTADIAQLAQTNAATGVEVWGGLVLNTTVGGINPMAVRAFAETSGNRAKIVWMPTHDSEFEVRYLKQERPFVRVSHEGELLPQVLQVLDLIAAYDLTLATGHVAPSEMLQIVDAAKARGIDRILITHPELGDQFGRPQRSLVVEAAAKGAFVEVVANELARSTRDRSIEEIREIGPANMVVSTDSGIIGTPNHTDAIVMAARTLRAAGFTEDELALMFIINPAKVLGLEPTGVGSSNTREP